MRQGALTTATSRGWGLAGFALAGGIAALAFASRDALLLGFVPVVAGFAWFGGWQWASAPALLGLAFGWSFADGREPFLLASYALGCTAVIALLELARRTRRSLVERRAGAGWLALASEAAGVGTFEWDLTSDRISWSPELAQIYGIAPGEFDGRYASWRAFVHPDDFGHELPREEALAREDWNGEFRIVRPNGETRWMLSRARLLRDARGRAERLIGINLDVTERKHAESALQASSALLDAALAAVPGTTFVWDVQRDELRREERGAAGAAASGPLKLADSLAQIHPDDRASFEQRLRAALASGAAYQNRFRTLASDGSLRFIEEWGTLERDAAGRPRHLRGISIDVTEREQVASALRESEERLRLSAEAAAIGTFAVDFAAGAIRYSPEACEILGVPHGLQHALTQPYELIHEADRAALRSAIEHALDPGGDRELRGEARISRGGETRWLSFRGRVELRDEAGTPTPSRALGAILDITEQKRALLALRASEEQRRLAFEANRVGTFVAELGKQRVEISSELRALLEIPSDAPVSVQAAMALIEASDLAELRRRFARAIAGEGGGRVSVDIRVGARPRWLAFNAQVEFQEGAAGRVPVRVSGVGIDITERKRAELQLRDGEKLLRAFVNNSAAIAWMKDEHGKYVFVSENFQRLLFRAGGALGKSDSDLWPAAIAGEHARSDRAVLEAELSQEGIERMPAADGSETWWRTAKFPFRDPEGRRYVGGIAVDVSAERRAEEQLREADRRKDRFLATLAHELRSPLAPLLNAAKLLEQEGLPETDLRHCREIIGRQVEQISRLLDDLLDISRITLGKVALRRRPVELAVVAQRALEMVQPLADARAHKLDVRLPPAPIWLDADLTRLVQVFSNLLGNSVRYTPPGGSITFEAERAGESLRVRVRDDGEGIAPEDLPRVFEMFGIGQRAHGRSRDGLGIGLALARGLIELHGGKLTGASDGIGRGAEFCVELPVLMAPPSSQETSGERTRESASERARPRRVLVADDLRDSADSMTIVLQLAGHEVTTAYDGAQAVELARAALPDVVVLDIGMPRLDGYEACRAIRALPGGEGVLIIALTGWGQPDDRRKAREAGFDHHLTKPVDPARLRALIASELRRAN